jgi:Mn-dependent DtxR family transcriptional regulator
MATYADQDGTRVHPGVELLARVMCVSEKTVDRSLKILRELGLITLVKKGNRHAKHADEYHLTAPTILLDRMLDPDESAGHG